MAACAGDSGGSFFGHLKRSNFGTRVSMSVMVLWYSPRLGAPVLSRGFFLFHALDRGIVSTPIAGHDLGRLFAQSIELHDPLALAQVPASEALHTVARSAARPHDLEPAALNFHVVSTKPSLRSMRSRRASMRSRRVLMPAI